ncbi:protein phosphatase inhibitor 2-like isoform X2 [Chrysoperla carnea]|uniref:protein phosphatase inhibitor 2-like isoform X2 n=1 Tax=Chrysoperla carnea TaxID=189513 RepID=UPI001D05FFAD|nr:protein phosphatase inhibitor 2-like isoform X2 [Chrysoperla carnea]
MMADNLAKRPSKGILKNSSSFDKPESSTNALENRRKSKETKWDEMNIIATLHPPDKDYGHMKIDEPKTPYNYETDEPHDQDELDAGLLAQKIQSGGSALPKFMKKQEDDESDDEEDDDLTEEEKARRKEFLAKRKKHYNEYYAVKLARKQLEEESEEEDEDDDDDETKEVGVKKCVNKKRS